MQTEEHSSFGGISPTAGVMEEGRRVHASGASFSKKNQKNFSNHLSKFHLKVGKTYPEKEGNEPLCM